MNQLDYVIFGIFAVCVAYGMYRGLVSETATLATVLLGCLLASRLYAAAGRLFFSPFITDDALCKILGAVMIFFAAGFIVRAVGDLAGRLIESLHLGWINHAAGIITGCVKAVVVSCLLVCLLNVFPSANRAMLEQSQLAPAVFTAAQKLRDLAEDILAGESETQIRQAKRIRRVEV
ncbi:MAG: CvpA family protein [Deltaproteobacteria bacterium]|nr:CvpA family protein [Deltaproteobacteria bacterium]